MSTEPEVNEEISNLIKTEQHNQIMDAIKYEGESTRLSNFKNTIIIAASILLSPIVYILVSKIIGGV